jgi:hypothetical protein
LRLGAATDKQLVSAKVVADVAVAEADFNGIERLLGACGSKTVIGVVEG